MHLSFESIAEFEHMARAMGYVKGTQLGELTVRLDGRALAADIDELVARLPGGEPVQVDSPAGLPNHGLIDGDEPVGIEQYVDTVLKPALTVATSDAPVPEEPAVRRKRRTKAEIEAEKAAQVHAATEALPNVPAVTASPLDNLRSETDKTMTQLATNVDALNAITEMAGLFPGDGPDAKLAHLNEGREFIAAHGFPAYNQTMMLADVPPNIAAHTPEQVSRHRAAMAWFVANKSKA